MLLYLRRDIAGILRAWTRSLRTPALRADRQARLGWYVIVGTVRWRQGPTPAWGPTLLATAVAFGVEYAVIAWYLRYIATHRFTPFVGVPHRRRCGSARTHRRRCPYARQLNSATLIPPRPRR